MLLSKDEIKTKAKLWLRANKDWLKEQKIKEDQKKKEKEESSKNINLTDHSVVNKPKRTRVRKPKNNTPVSNPQEAIERMLQEKKLSSKINYDVLKNLNKDFVSKHFIQYIRYFKNLNNIFFLIFFRKQLDE